MTLGQRIQAERTKLGLSQEGLGEKIGVSRQAVSKWEADGAVPDTDKLISLSKLFGLSLNALLQVEGPAEPVKKARRRALLKNAGHVLTGVLAAAAIAVICLQWGQIRALAGRVEALEAKTAALEAQAGQPAGLDASLPLVAAFDFSATQTISTHSASATLRLMLTPAQLPQGLVVSFTITPEYGVPTTVEAEDLGGGSYRAIATLADYYGYGAITVTAILDDGTRQCAQGLVRILSIRENGCSWDPIWQA